MDANVNQDKNIDKGPISYLSTFENWGRRVFSKLRGESKIIPKHPVWSRLKKIVWASIAEATALVLGLLFIALYGGNYLGAHKRVNISFLSDDIRSWVDQSLGQEGVVGDVFLEWETENGLVVLDTQNVRVTDKAQLNSENLAGIKIAFDVYKVIRGQIEPESIIIDGGRLTWRVDEKGHIIAGIGAPDTIGHWGVFFDSQKQARSNEQFFSFGSIQSLEARNIILYVRDELRQTQFDVIDMSLRVKQTQKEKHLSYMMINGIGQLQGRNQNDSNSGGFSINIDMDSEFKNVSLEARFNALNLSDIAPRQGRFKEFSGFDIPLQGQVLLKTNEDMGLESFELDMRAERGTYEYLSVKDRLDFAHISGIYDQGSSTVKFTTLDLNSPKIRLTGTAEFKNIGTFKNRFRTDKLNINLSLDDVYFDLTQYFKAPFQFSKIMVSTDWMWKDKRFVIDRYEFISNRHANDPAYTIGGSLELELVKTGGLKNIRGNLSVSGGFNTEHFKSYWPNEFVPGARRWMFKALKAGNFDVLRAVFDLDNQVLSGAPMTPEQMDLQFKISDATVKYMDHMPAYIDVDATGAISGNQLTVSALGGQVGKMIVERGAVNIPQLRPKGGDFTIDVNGHGDVPEMLRLIDNKPFEYTRRYGVNAEDFTGHGRVSLRITRPLLEFFDLDRIRYDITGDFVEASAPFQFGSYGLTNGQVHVRGNKDGLTIEGPVNLGPWVANLKVTENFKQIPRMPTQHELSGRVDRATLDKFGLGLRQYFDGDFNVVIKAQGKGPQIDEAFLVADFENTEFTMASYHKPKGEKAVLKGAIIQEPSENNNETVLGFDQFTMDGTGLNVKGAARFFSNGKLVDLKLDQLFLDGLSDITLYVRPNNDATRFLVDVSGQYFDISHWVKNFISVEREPLGLPFELSADLDRLNIKPGLIASESQARIKHDGTDIISGQIHGVIFDEKISANISATTEGYKTLSIKVPEVGKALYVFSNSTRIKGGTLFVEGQLSSQLEGGGFVGTVGMHDFTITEAPALAQLLSFASIRGLIDTLSGSGMHFDRLRSQIEYRDGVLNMSEARMSGSALGMTADGVVSFKNRKVDVDGVLVPAYTANSMFADIPIIGKIVVGKKGEGILGLNYTIKGPFEQTEVVVNPLSALTPGFLRNIFEPNRSKDKEIMGDMSRNNSNKVQKPDDPAVGDKPIPPVE